MEIPILAYRYNQQVTQYLEQHLGLQIHLFVHLQEIVIRQDLKHMVTIKELVSSMQDNQMLMVVVSHTTVTTHLVHLVLSKVMTSHSLEEIMAQIQELLSIVTTILHSTSSDRLDQELHKELHHL